MSVAGRLSSSMLDLLAAAGPGGFAVPRCQACGHHFYPAQSWCPVCLAGDIAYVEDAGLATVVSMTELHISFDAVWQRLLPVHVACVRTASGVSLFALADGVLNQGSAVQVFVSQAPDELPALLRVRNC